LELDETLDRCLENNHVDDGTESELDELLDSCLENSHDDDRTLTELEVNELLDAASEEQGQVMSVHGPLKAQEAEAVPEMHDATHCTESDVQKGKKRELSLRPEDHDVTMSRRRR
jgi:hypothetical protein